MFKMTLAAVAAGAAIFASTFSAQALDRRVRIINDTGVEMREFYASSVGVTTWEEDILGRHTLPSGSSVVINIDDGTGYCMYDFRAVFADGDVLERKRVNVCEIGSFRYH